MKIVERERKSSRILLYILTAIIILLIWAAIPEGISELLRVKAFLLFAMYLLYIILWIKCTRAMKSLFFVFLCYTALTNAGQLFLTAFDIEITGYVNVIEWATETQILKAMDYQVYCTVFLATCGLIARENHGVAIAFEPAGEAGKTLVKRDYITLGDLIFLASGMLYTVFNIIRLETRVGSAYMDAFQSGEAKGAPFLVSMLFYISMYCALFAHREKGDHFKKVIYAVNIVVGITGLLFGSRNVLIPMVFGILFLWNFHEMKLTLPKKIGAVFVVVFAFYIMGTFLNIRRTELSSLNLSAIADALFGAGLKEQLIATVSEMGGSLRVLTTTITAVDKGLVQSEQTFLYTFLKGVVPQVEILDWLDIQEPVRWRLSQWITDTYGQNAGWGYSMYAEAYYNFKELGWLFMAAFGYFYAWLECRIEKMYLKGYTVAASGWLFAAAYMIFLARAESLLLTTRLRYSLYLGIVCALLRNRIKFPEIRLRWKNKI